MPTHDRREFLTYGAALAAAATLPSFATAGGGGPTATTSSGPFTLMALPYAQSDLDPVISANTISFHYGKHHQGYVNKLNELTANSDLASKSLVDVIKATHGTDKVGIFNNAAQIWNHDFYWNSMKKGGGGQPTGKVATAIDSSFGSWDEFKKQFTTAATTHFGSGWVWLVKEGDKLKIVKTSNADTPLTAGQTALLVIDVWEHAYYLDYQNRRPDYVNQWFDKLINWDYANQNLG